MQWILQKKSTKENYFCRMKIKGLLVLLFYFGVFTACTNITDSHADKKVFRYNEAAGITSLDPAFAKDQSNSWACLQLFNGLVELDESLNIRPAIAKSWEMTPDAKKYIFTLRTDVYFQSIQNENGFSFPGRKVVAADFVFSLNRLTDPLVASPGAWVMNAVLKDAHGKLSGLQALNDSMLSIELKNPFPPFLSLLSMPYCSVVPKEVVEQFGNDFRSHPCGTGPFRFHFWKEGVKLIYHKNENYWESDGEKKLPYLDAIEISFINDKQSAFLEFMKGRLDFLSGLDASYKDELLTRTGTLQDRYQGKVRLETTPYLNTEYLGILMKPDPSGKNLLLDKNIRKALNCSFDRHKMMTYLRNNMGSPGIYGFVPPGLPSFDSTANPAAMYSPNEGRALLTAAGYPNGKGVPEIILSTTSAYLDLCEYIKSQWEDIGLKIRIDVNQAAIHRKMVAEQKLTFFRGSWIADYPDAENYLSLFYSKNFAPNGPNYTHFSNAKYDNLYEQSTSAVNDSIRYSYYREMDQIIREEAPVIVLYYDKVLRLTQLNIDGLSNNAMNLLVLKKVSKR